MSKIVENDSAHGAEPIANEEEARARRQILTGGAAMAFTALGASAASAQSRAAEAAYQTGKPAPRRAEYRGPAAGNPRGAPAVNGGDVENRIIARALRDETYRRRLIANPRMVIGEEVGNAFPRNVQVRVLQETPDTVYVVIPYVPAAGRERVSEMDLESGAAGMAARSWLRRCRPSCACSSLSVCNK